MERKTLIEDIFYKEYGIKHDIKENEIDRFEIWFFLKQNEVFSKSIRPYHQSDKQKDSNLYKYFYIQKGKLISAETRMRLREIEVDFSTLGKPKNKYYNEVLKYTTISNSGNIYTVDFDNLMVLPILAFDKKEDKEELIKNNNLYFFIY